MSGTEKVWLGTEGAYLGIIVLDQVPFTRTKRGSATQAWLEGVDPPVTGAEWAVWAGGSRVGGGYMYAVGRGTARNVAS